MQQTLLLLWIVDPAAATDLVSTTDPADAGDLVAVADPAFYCHGLEFAAAPVVLHMFAMDLTVDALAVV